MQLTYPTRTELVKRYDWMQIKSLTKAAVCLYSVSPALLFAATLAEPQQLEVIEVTAQKVVQNIQDVPVSVSTLSGSVIEEKSINNLSELSAYIPNLTIADSVINTNIFIRGIGSGSNRSFEQSVGMFIDGVYMGRDRQFRAPFLDLARAEVLRGPQGVLFGKNTIAGALNLTTQGATAGADSSASLSLDWDAEYDQHSVTAIVDSALNDAVGWRIAYKTSQGDGYMRNLYLDQQEPAKDEELLRLSVHWQVSEDLDARFKLERSDFRLNGAFSQVIKLQPLSGVARYMATVLLPEFGEGFEANQDWLRSADEQIVKDQRDTSTDTIALKLEQNLEQGRLSSITGYSGYQTLESSDADISPVPFLGITDRHDFSQFSQEILFHSTQNSDFYYTAGVFYLESDLLIDYWADANVVPLTPLLINALRTTPARLVEPTAPPGLTLWDAGIRPENVNRTISFQQDTTLWSVFMQGSWQLDPQLRLIPGGRYTKENKAASRAGMLAQYGSAAHHNAVPASRNATVTALLMHVTSPLAFYQGERDESTFTPSLKLQYDLTPDLMFYASAERGYKAGGVNSAADASSTNQQFEEEKATGLELGLKSDLFQHKARLNLAAFHTRFDDLQVTSWNGFSFDVGNAAAAVAQGLEVDGQWKPAKNWTMSAAMAYLDSHYTDYKTGPCTAQVIATQGIGSVCDLTGKTTTYAPKWSGSLFVDHTMELFSAVELRTSLNLNYSAPYFLDADLDPELVQQTYTTVGLRLALAAFDDQWELALVGKNLTEQRILNAGQDMPLISGGYAAHISAPRTLTVQGRYRF
jgi:iron complex outermembrane receptor protein